MTDKLADDTVELRLAVLLHRLADVSDVLAYLYLVDTEVERLLGRIEQISHLWIYLPYREGKGAIANEAVQLRTEIYRDDISLLEDNVRAGDTMDDDLIDRGTDAPREALISETGGVASVADDEVVRHLIQLCRTDPGSDVLSHLGEGTAIELIGEIELIDLLSRLEDNVIATDHLCKVFLSLEISGTYYRCDP